MRLSLKIRFSDEAALGPGKVRLLELICETGSISAAGRELGMAYSRAWKLVNELNEIFKEPLVIAQPGGVKGGTAAVTPLGRDVITRYRSIESDLSEHAAAQLAALDRYVRRSKRNSTQH
jgi:molybdate transport system regulatory protein